jgi:hypothetical protein
MNSNDSADGVARLDDLVKKLDAAYAPVLVKGKKYAGNNPYIVNMINLLLEEEALKPEDIVFDANIMCMGDYAGRKYLFHDGLERITHEINEGYIAVRERWNSMEEGK